MTEKKVLQLYTDLGDKIKRLPREDKGALLEAMFAWARDEALPEDMPLAAAVAWDFVLPMLEAANAKYQEICEVRRKAALLRWEKEHAKDANDMQTDANDMQTDANDMQTDANGCNKEKEKDIKEKRDAYASPKKKPARPTLEEVRNYANEHGYALDAQHFYDYYEANGWKVGRNPMKNWQAAVRNWLKNDFDRGKSRSKQEDFAAFMAEQAAIERAEDEARGI